MKKGREEEEEEENIKNIKQDLENWIKILQIIIIELNWMKFKKLFQQFKIKFKNPISCNTNDGEFIYLNISSEYLVLNSLRVYGKARYQELKESCEILGVKFIY